MNSNPIQFRLRRLFWLSHSCLLAIALLFTVDSSASFGQTGQVNTAANQPAGNDIGPRIDFRNDVLPIFERSCLECHSEENVQGNLNLLSRESIDEGGFTGRPIIGSSLEESELYQRIHSNDEDYRMPRSDSGLADDEIEIIAKWIEQGGSFARAAHPQPETSFTDRLAQVWVTVEKSWNRKPLRYAAYLVIPLAVYWLFRFLFVVVRFLKKPSDDDFYVQPTSPMRTPIYVSTLVCLAAAIVFQHGSLNESASELETLSAQLNAAQRIPVQDPNKPPNAPHPMHPPRLGGMYYRGNDERSSQLFNNGFYRTAELQIILVDGNSNPLEIGDSIPTNGVSIRLKIRRSSGAEYRMFDARSLKSTYVSSTFRKTETASDRKTLKVVEKDQEWEVTYPLDIAGEQSITDGIQKTGDLYVYYGPLEQTRIHYLIHYDLVIKDNKIASGSELWMASTYNLNGRVMLPSQKNILLDRWFDFRPIPENLDREDSVPNAQPVPTQ